MIPTPSLREAFKTARRAEGSLPGRGDLLGSGRSGLVFRENDPQGRETAVKIFDSDSVTKLVQYILLGAPNPYGWNEDAVRCALLRRQILAPLVRHWFGEKVSVAGGMHAEWCEQYRTYQLTTEFVPGRAPLLHQPLSREGRREVRELVDEVMHPLQKHLIASGFDGMVWQAGLGNPVALANFLLIKKDDGSLAFSWIDLESGVPAWFPANPLRLFSYYLPRSWRHRAPLFDDVDLERMDSYLEDHTDSLTASLGEDVFSQLLNDARTLASHQTAWKSQPRAQRSVDYQYSKGMLTEAEAAYFRSHAVRWYSREALRLPRKATLKGWKLIRSGIRFLMTFDYAGLARGVGRFLTSQKYRRRVAENLVEKRISSWHRRRQIDHETSTFLRTRLKQEESCAYIMDFGVHMAIKPFVKTIEWIIFPTLLAAGLVSQETVLIAVATGGILARTLYTGGRFIQAAVKGRELPWVALLIGAIPVFGNLAYPCQLVYSSTDDEDSLAQFILYDGFTAIGRKIPIWGGKDTLTEHFFNHIPDHIVRKSGAPLPDNA